MYSGWAGRFLLQASAFRTRTTIIGTGYNNQYTFSDGSNLSVLPEDYNIFLGKIVYKANIKNKK